MAASLWEDHVVTSGSALRDSVTTDVCVIGAGIAGLSVALETARRGHATVVVDMRRPGAGETGYTTAHLSTALDRGWTTLGRIHGREAAGVVAASHATAIDRIEALVREHDIACDFTRLDGFLIGTPGTEATIAAEYEAARSAGVDVELLARSPLPTMGDGAAIRYSRQAQLHPLRYLQGLADAFARAGGRLVCDARVTSIDGTGPFRVCLDGGATVLAESVVLATNSPVAGGLTPHVKQAPYRTYAIAARLPRDTLPPALYWDTAEPFHYVRLADSDDPAHPWLIVGGEDHKTGQDDDGVDRWSRLHAWATSVLWDPLESTCRHASLSIL